MKNIFFTFAILFCVTISIKSQIKFENRTEFDYDEIKEIPDICKFGKQGLIIFSKSKDFEVGKSTYIYDKYDANLEKIETKTVTVKNNNTVKNLSDKDRMHTLIAQRTGPFTLVTIDVSTMEMTEVKGELPKNTTIKESEICGDNIVVILKKKVIIFCIL